MYYTNAKYVGYYTLNILMLSKREPHCFLRMSCAFCYYGLVLMSSELFRSGFDPVSMAVNRETNVSVSDCHPLKTTDYMDLLWTTLAEFPGIFATIFIIEKCGRKKTMAFQFLLYAGCVILLTSTGK